MSERALTGQRLMSKDIPNLVSTYTSLSGGWDVSGTGWEVDGNDLYYETYFDLSGYSLDDLTTVIDLILLQDSNAYYITNAAPENLVTILDIVSEERLSASDVSALAADGTYPGTSGSTENYDQVKYCNVRVLSPQTDFTYAQHLGVMSGGSYGSNSPTVADKLWIYRVIRVAQTDLDTVVFQIPATRFVMGATVVKEADLPYMMRLKRSYELANYD